MTLKVRCCHHCTDRWMDGNTTCHASCKRYIEEVEKNKAIKRSMRDNNLEYAYRKERFNRISDGVMHASNISKFRNPRREWHDEM